MQSANALKYISVYARVELCRQKAKDAIGAELAWLTGKQGEPEWPQFPPSPARSRRRLVLGPENRKQKPVEEPPDPEMYADHQAAALRPESKRPEWTALTSGMGHFSVQMVILDQVR